VTRKKEETIPVKWVRAEDKGGVVQKITKKKMAGPSPYVTPHGEERVDKL